ncbi:hypothetical protein PPL_09314 [Heterostelium album PN500]|uniref:Uncharacterized protein n=1 Tax=Heterostelium pallidum (strain ATCC 26659 / Pp 5 / PN500) TaxID=670386 RepID=D3BL82_HETP5|nr:hypothetical protein PPL_09314 [Heterostelium album PN500]EFA77816.1 hypothetical protein PPL_09314 [Heterostelium album PN500]|eukprot:XP_020429944.1 hypothetical protein PPL_09314 [Heterostelium album PN500]
MAELRFQVEQVMVLENGMPTTTTTAKKGSNQRIIGISEDGILVLSKDETEIIETVEWSEIERIKLQENFIIWEIYLIDQRCLFFRSQNAYHIHTATDNYISTLLRNNKINQFSSNSFDTNNCTLQSKCIPRRGTSFYNYQNDFDYIIN